LLLRRLARPRGAFSGRGLSLRAVPPRSASPSIRRGFLVTVVFDCCECGRHMISFGYGSEQIPEPPLCAACLMLPGWQSVPELRRRLDPTMRDREGAPDEHSPDHHH